METTGNQDLAPSAQTPDSTAMPAMDTTKATPSMQKTTDVVAESNDVPADESSSAETPPVEVPSPGFTAINSTSAQASFADAQSAETTLVESSPLSSPRKHAAEDDANSDNESIVSKKPKTDSPATNGGQRKKSGKTKASRLIARSYQECEEYDRKLVDMAAANEPWAKIRVEWEKITGERSLPSTLPNRYQRLMNNFTVIPDKDKVRLIVAKQKIEKQFEAEKWSKIAEEMEDQGSCKYKDTVLERQHKKMMLDAEDLPPIGSTTKKNTKADAVADDDTLVGDE